MRRRSRNGGRATVVRRSPRPTIVAALVYTALALVLVGPGLVPGRTLSSSDFLWSATPWLTSAPPGVSGFGSNPAIGDQVLVFGPFRRYIRRELPHVPLWNPYLMAGRPFLANSQSAILSPFSVLAYTLPEARAPAVTAGLKVVLAALGTYGLACALAMPFGAALLAGVVYGLSLWFVGWLSWPLTSVWTVLPWLWLLADRIARRPGPLTFAALAVAIALQYVGGHPQSSFQVLAATLVFFVLRLAAHRRRQAPGERGLRAPVAAFVAAGALGTALAAVTLLPFLELLAHSADRTERATFANVHIPGRYLLGIFLHDFWGRSTEVAIGNAPFLQDRAFYVGALPLMLVGAAVAARPRLDRLGVAAIGAFCLAVAVGAPPLQWLMGQLPGFSQAQNTRLVIVFALCAALLAGWGLQDLAQRRPTGARPRWGPIAFGAAVLLAPLVWIVVAGTRPGLANVGHASLAALDLVSIHPPGFNDPAARLAVSNEIRLASLLEWLVLAALALALLIARVGARVGPRGFTVLAVLLVAGDLLKAGYGYNPAIPISHARQPVTPALRHLQAQRPNRFVGLSVQSPFAGQSPVPPDVAMDYGLSDARGYDYPIEERYWRLWKAEVSDPSCAFHFCTTGAPARPEALRALGLLSVNRLMQSRLDPKLRLAGARLVYDGPDARIYANDRALPKAFVVDRQRVVPDAEAALRAVSSPAFRPRRAARVEAGDATATVGSGAPTGPPGEAQLLSYGAERLSLQTRTSRPGLAVVTDGWYPGWKATVDGREAPIHRVDFLLRGVAVGPGRHVVELRYRPMSVRVGWIVSGLALVVLVGTLAVGLRRRAGADRPGRPGARRLA